MSQNLEFVVDAESHSPAKTTVRTRHFTLVIDEPQSLGGTDTAPNPVEYLLASYAGCLNVVAHHTAQELGIRPGKISFTLSGMLNPANLLEGNTDQRPGFQSIEVKLFTELPLSEKEHQDWQLCIEKRCPVGDNLAQPTPISLAIFSATHVN